MAYGYGCGKDKKVGRRQVKKKKEELGRLLLEKRRDGRRTREKRHRGSVIRRARGRREYSNIHWTVVASDQYCGSSLVRKCARLLL